VDSGIPYVIADAGRSAADSVSRSFPDRTNARPSSAMQANRVRVLQPAETVYSIKRFMGRRGAEIGREEMLVTYPVAGEGAGPVASKFTGRSYTPEEISAEILKKLKARRRSRAGRNLSRARSSPSPPTSTTPSATPPSGPANWPA
jgi:molecular chaperone DnaK